MYKTTKLKRPKKIEKIEHIIFFDTESELIEKSENVTEHRLYLFCAYEINRFFDEDKNEIKQTYKKRKIADYKLNYAGEAETITKIWNYLDKFIKKHKKSYICSHNLKYDSLVIKCLQNFTVLNYEITSYSFSNPFFISIKTEDKKHDCTFFSSTNIFQNSIKNLGNMLKLNKIEFDYYADLKKYTNKAITYCYRDVEILYKTFKNWWEFLKQFNCSEKITVASQSLQIFKSNFLPENFEIEIHRIKELHKAERVGYMGGRNECFKIGCFEKIFALDINSMYPFCMKNFKLPYKKIGTRSTISKDQLKELLKYDDYYIYAKCLIKIDKPKIGKIYNSRLCFPIGTFWQYIHDIEFREILDIDKEIIKIYDVIIYKKDYIFTDFVDFFYKKRIEAKKQKNDIYTYLYKLILNSLYGKFGQKKIETVIIKENDFKIGTEFEVEEKKDGTIERRKVDYLGYFKSYNKTAGEAYNSFPIIAGAITSIARALLFKYLSVANFENCYYCDTDSIFCNSDGARNLYQSGMLSNSELGKLKIEKYCKKLVINNCKDYFYINDKNKNFEKKKGINLKSSKKLTETEFLTDYWIGYSDYIRNNYTHYTVLKRVKKYSENYEKGINLNGKIYPFEIFEDEKYKKIEFEY